MRFAALLGADMQSVEEGLHVAEGLDAVAVNMEAILHIVIHRSLLWILDCTSRSLPVLKGTMQDMHQRCQRCSTPRLQLFLQGIFREQSRT